MEGCYTCAPQTSQSTNRPIDQPTNQPKEDKRARASAFLQIISSKSPLIRFLYICMLEDLFAMSTIETETGDSGGSMWYFVTSVVSYVPNYRVLVLY